MNISKILFVFLAIQTSIFAQQFTISGSVISSTGFQPLSFANIQVANSTRGTSSNIEGMYELMLPEGKYKLIASYIGFKKDTAEVELTSNRTINFTLKNAEIGLPEIIIVPGENPALDIIRKAIARKNEREKKLSAYIFQAYTKGIIKTTKEIGTGENSFSLSVGVKDTAQLKITGIIENTSKGYFKAPDKYKEEIIARKQSANIPPQVNVLTGGRAVQSFYEDKTEFFGRSVLSPIAEGALDFYYYYIENQLAIDDEQIFQIYFAPEDASEPGLFGRIYIKEPDYDLVRADLELNGAALPGGIFQKVALFQQYLEYGNGIYMPIDYRIFANGNVLGLARFGFEFNTILYNYEINPEIENSFFDKALVTVLPSADEKADEYWTRTQSIPNSAEENLAYGRIDSLKSIPKTFGDRFSFLSTETDIGGGFQIPGPLGLYHFNKVEGHAFDFFINYFDSDKKRLTSSADFSYGLDDERFKYDISVEYLLGDYRTKSVSFNVFNNLRDLFGESVNYNRFTSTFLSLLNKNDFRNYYYSKGFEAKASAEIIPEIELNAGALYRIDESATVNTDFSFFDKDERFFNKPVYDAEISGAAIGFKIDLRRYIEDGFFRRRISGGESFFILKGSIFSSNKDFSSDLNFDIYNLNLYGTLNSFKSASLDYNLTGFYGKGIVPFQMMYALPGNISSGAKDFSFRTLGIGEYFGDEVIALNLEHNFNDELFRLLNVPVLEDMQLVFGVHFNAAYLKISEKSKGLLPVDYDEFLNTFYEAGFSIGQTLLPVSFEFTWKLNHRGNSNFVFGINTFLL